MFSGNAFDVMAVAKIHFNFIYSKNRRELRLLPARTAGRTIYHRTREQGSIGFQPVSRTE
jgi:hypothetical protein